MSAQHRKRDVIAKFEARLAFYIAQNRYLARGISTANDGALSISASQAVNAGHDLAFIKRGTNWRLALPHTGNYPYNKLFGMAWDIPETWHKGVPTGWGW